VRRLLALVPAGIVACLTLVGPASADTAGYSAIGPPTSLNAVAFASDGSIFGTPAKHIDIDSVNPPAALWRSTDHGRTWSELYHPASGSRLVLLAASPTAAYLQEAPPGQSVRTERFDIASAHVTRLDVDLPIAIDAAGTAYGSGRFFDPVLTRCPLTADRCDSVPLPAGSHGVVAVDPLSVGVLATGSSTVMGGAILRSTDGGASWTQGGHVDCAAGCTMAFSGPAAQTLYVADIYDFKVSHDAGLTFASHTLPASGASGIVVGSQPAAMLSSGGGASLVRAVGEGTSFAPLTLPGGFPVLDPTDATHFFLTGPDGELQTHDSGATVSDVVDVRFGIAALLPGAVVAGSGSEIYLGVSGPSVWHSDDRGATWSRAAVPAGGAVTRIFVSRDNPRVAYTSGEPGGAMRTGDGGVHWQLLPQSRTVVGILPGDPNHIFALDQGLSESSDAGTTWSIAPPSASCTLVAGTNGRVTCQGLVAPLPPLSSGPPRFFAYGLYGSPDAPGSYAVASGALLGDVDDDWHLAPSLALTGAFGPSGPLAAGLAAWPAKTGTTLYGFDGTQNTTWVRRGSGRWWRLQAGGRLLYVLTLLDATHAIVNEVTPSGGSVSGAGIAVIDLAHPAVEPPTVQATASGLLCVVPWPASDAETSAYAWRRDGSVIPGAVSAQLTPVAADRGHDLTCRATARTDWGSTSLVSANAYRVPAPAAAWRRLSLAGRALFGHVLRCGAALRVAWLRSGRLIAGAHARTHRVGPLDEGRTLACQSKTAGGKLARSPALRVPRPHGGRATMAPRP
jgi:hypothetical protein